MSKELDIIRKIQLANRQHMNAIIEGLSKCQRQYAKNRQNKVFEEYYVNYIQADIHKFYDSCVEIVGGDFDELLAEFNGKINIDIYEEDEKNDQATSR